ncbi:uncharacterized protein C8A04DRAFT_25058 [Dichotomopilus funicola]|uniref:Uncharacterized protein n=1 Tax=Dichotomopilus funicola TaxID=1934379 RepID=A0AAN6V9B5_9PEZI|nr:hypothetical protein C8A04DRAFT_25058 [Dichotomopilus funicola]
MGGRIWSRAEERIFWLQLVPHSPRRLGADLQNEEQSWEWVAKQMTAKMGDNARRKYTGLGAFEHFFLNVHQCRFSPNIGTMHYKYWKAEKEAKKRKQGNQPEPADQAGNGEASTAAASAGGSASPAVAAESPNEPQGVRALVDNAAAEIASQNGQTDHSIVIDC